MLLSCCGARKNHRAYADPRFFRPLPLVRVAPPATGGAPLTPQIFTGFASSNLPYNEKITKTKRSWALWQRIKGSDYIRRPPTAADATNDPAVSQAVLAGAASRFGYIFAPAWEGQKLRFASVEPSAAALVRAAFRWFKSGGVAAKNKSHPKGWDLFFGAASQI